MATGRAIGRVRRLAAFVLASPPSGRWEPLVARLVLAAVFIPTGLGKFVHHDAYVTRFDRWGFPAPGVVATAVGVVEVVFGLAMLLGVVPRLAGAVLAGEMVGALLTAGRIDGGMDLWLPLVMLALALFVAVAGAGRLRIDLPLPRCLGFAAGAPRAAGRPRHRTDP
jgi:putative oxidoreductase